MIVRGHRDQCLDDIIFVERHALDAASATLLCLICIDRSALDVSARGHRDDDILHRDQIFIVHLHSGIRDLCTALIAIFFFDLAQFLPDDLVDTGFIGKDIAQIRDRCEQLVILCLNLISFQSGQPAQLHLQDGLGLYF